MTAPLYDIKAKFSEYVSLAEKGEVVEITKHGTATSVIISMNLYNQLKDEYEQNHRPGFMEMVEKWRKECGILQQDEAEEYCKVLERLRQEDNQIDETGLNPWD